MSESTEQSGRTAWARFFGRAAAVLTIAAVVGVLAALWLTTGLFDFSSGTTSPEVQGIVSRIDRDVIVLKTADGDVTIHIAEDTLLLDANGNEISGGDIAPGQAVRVNVKKENGEYSAQRIGVQNGGEEGGGQEVEFSGVISAVSGSTVTVRASFGVVTVLIDSQAEVEGELAPDVAVKVHATVQGDGVYLARQIEIMVAGDGEGGSGADDDGQGSLGLGDGDTGRYEREAE